MEIESKYTASETQLKALMQMSALGRYSLGGMKEQFLTDRYLDTKERDMEQAGYACRIREGNGQFMLTVKGLGGVEGPIHQREEYEVEIEEDTCPDEWPDSPARDLVLSLNNSRPLVELCLIDQIRTKREIHQGRRHVADMSLDIVDMGSAGQITRVYEVEVELVQGALEDLQNLDKVLQMYKLRPEPLSKFERAMALIKG